MPYLHACIPRARAHANFTAPPAPIHDAYVYTAVIANTSQLTRTSSSLDDTNEYNYSPVRASEMSRDTKTLTYRNRKVTFSSALSSLSNSLECVMWAYNLFRTKGGGQVLRHGNNSNAPTIHIPSNEFSDGYSDKQQGLRVIGTKAHIHIFPYAEISDSRISYRYCRSVQFTRTESSSFTCIPVSSPPPGHPSMANSHNPTTAAGAKTKYNSGMREQPEN